MAVQEMDGAESEEGGLMPQNVGKIFEHQWKISVPEYALCLRLKDSTGAFGAGNLRFSSKNPFDYLMWNPKRRLLFALELKSVAGRSISFDRTEDDKNGEIHFHQIEGLKEWNSFDGTICGFVIEFRELEMTIYLPIVEFQKLVGIIDKKSFTIDDLDEHGIFYMVIPQTKLVKYYKYDVDYFITFAKEYRRK